MKIKIYIRTGTFFQMIYHMGSQIPSCDTMWNTQENLSPVPAGGMLVARIRHQLLTSVYLPFLGYGVNKVVFEQLRASCVD